MELKRDYVKVTRKAKYRFNRTRVELKRKNYPVCFYSIEVLIEPEWNWNKMQIHHKESPYIVLIEPEWNWNDEVIAEINKALQF